MILKHFNQNPVSVLQTYVSWFIIHALSIMSYDNIVCFEKQNSYTFTFGWPWVYYFIEMSYLVVEQKEKQMP